MNDSDIIKALGNMQYGGHSCKNCNFKITKGDDRCGLKGCNISRQAALLINRQKEEIERLENTLNDVLDRQPVLVQQSEQYAKSNAITAYMEEVERRCIKSGLYPVIVKNILHNVKEDMVGE